MIYFDVTKAGRSGHASGLNRVSARLRDELGARATAIEWHERSREFRLAGTRTAVAWCRDDWFFTGELFSESERPGFSDWLGKRRCQSAAIFHDAIPLKLPHITWPQSVARHPSYLSLLAEFDRVLAVSQASAADLREFWRWQGRSPRARLGTLALGADFTRLPRAALTVAPAPVLLCVGILEPRKNQALLLDVCESLWNGGLKFQLHLVGRVNPHFGPPLVTRLKTLRRSGRAITHHEGVSDAALLQLYRTARATVFPTIAEGCGLPLLESLWLGVPCVCSDLPVLRENSDAGGCVPVAPNDQALWSTTLRRVLTDDVMWRTLATAASTRPLPTWAETAQQLLAALDLA